MHVDRSHTAKSSQPDRGKMDPTPQNEAVWRQGEQNRTGVSTQSSLQVVLNTDYPWTKHVNNHNL